MATEYILVALTKKLKLPLYTQTFKQKEEAFKLYHSLCEQNPQENFRVLRRQITEQIVAESDDYRQAKFDF